LGVIDSLQDERPFITSISQILGAFHHLMMRQLRKPDQCRRWQFRVEKSPNGNHPSPGVNQRRIMNNSKAIHSTPSNASHRATRAHRMLAASVVAALGAASSLIGAPLASAATKAKPASKPASKGVSVVEANVCPKGVKTKVAVQKTGKWGDVIKLWENADDTVAPKWTMAVGDESHTRLVFSVIAEQSGWLQVNMPVKPNGSVGWVKADDVTTYISPFFVLIELSKRRLTACNSGVVIAREPAGIGAANLGVTPTGTFYLLDLLRNPKSKQAGYGPFAFGLNGFTESPAVSKLFDGGRLGIHGTSSKGIGTPISHGCVRISNAAITMLSKTLFLGTPVQIVT
jgi:lipoprotein-anchoring transpeptidase ErfK/SrfK